MSTAGYLKFVRNSAILANASKAKPQKLGIPNWWNTLPQYREEILKGTEADFHKIAGNKFWNELGQSPTWDNISKYHEMLCLNKTKKKVLVNDFHTHSLGQEEARQKGWKRSES
jgi:hypothetical protein